jgi:hypothetical protein
MNATTSGWFLFITSLGMMAGLMGNELVTLKSWSEATTIAFVGKMLMHFSVVIGAFIGGKMIPGGNR